jgi:hypothetical protein
VVGDPLGFGIQVGRVSPLARFGQFCLDPLPLGPNKR